MNQRDISRQFCQKCGIVKDICGCKKSKKVKKTIIMHQHCGPDGKPTGALHPKDATHPKASTQAAHNRTMKDIKNG